MFLNGRDVHGRTKICNVHLFCRTNPGRCQPAWDPFFVIKESFLLRFRMDYTTINYV